MIRGSCLCGAVTFEVERAVGPFELCHCNRCRKVSGSAFMAGVAVSRGEFRLLTGRDRIKRYEAPLLESPPRYTVCFCLDCGSPLPDPDGGPASETIEIPAGLLDDDPVLRPDKHIFVELNAAWFPITDTLPQMDKETLRRHRAVKSRPRD